MGPKIELKSASATHVERNFDLATTTAGMNRSSSEERERWERVLE